MKATSTILLALACGFVAGIVLSQVVGVVGLFLFDRPIGIRGLPLILAVAGAGLAARSLRRQPPT